MTEVREEKVKFEELTKEMQEELSNGKGSDEEEDKDEQ